VGGYASQNVLGAMGERKSGSILRNSQKIGRSVQPGALLLPLKRAAENLAQPLWIRSTTSREKRNSKKA